MFYDEYKIILKNKALYSRKNFALIFVVRIRDGGFTNFTNFKCAMLVYQLCFHSTCLLYLGFWII